MRQWHQPNPRTPPPPLAAHRPPPPCGCARKQDCTPRTARRPLSQGGGKTLSAKVPSSCSHSKRSGAHKTCPPPKSGPNCCAGWKYPSCCTGLTSPHTAARPSGGARGHGASPPASCPEPRAGQHPDSPADYPSGLNPHSPATSHKAGGRPARLTGSLRPATRVSIIQNTVVPWRP